MPSMEEFFVQLITAIAEEMYEESIINELQKECTSLRITSSSLSKILALLLIHYRVLPVQA